MHVTVRIDRENQRFYTRINGINNDVKYRQLDPKLIEVVSVNVNEELKELGVEEELLYHIFIFAQKEGMKIIPACDSVVEYLSKHKEFNCVATTELAA